ncbi:MAG: hypothetical protein HRT72_02250 [Flavobacteriales bacterium]|nr:hypothetical protein [Flavobacteriales bacterium]
MEKIFLLLLSTIITTFVLGQSLKLKTYTSEDWDSWEVDNSIELKTYTNNDFDYWEIRGN